jgi:hypothetical protein
MADYYPLLAKAVAGLPNSTPDARRAIYERARTALLGQLRRLEPPVPEADVERESKALEIAVARLEAELAPPESEPEKASAPEPPLEPGPEHVTAPESAAIAEPPPDAVAPPPQTMEERPEPPAETSKAEAAIAKPTAPERPARREARASPLARPPLFFKVQRERTLATPTSLSPRPPPAAPADKALSPQKPAEAFIEGTPGGQTSISPELRSEDRVSEDRFSAEPRSTPFGVREPVAEELVGDVDAGRMAANGQPVQSAADRQISSPVARTRPDAQRPFAPQPAQERVAPKRLWIVGFVVGLLVLIVAISAYELRDRPEDLRQKAATPVISPEANANGKIVDRVGVAGAQPQGAPASSPSENAEASGDQAAKSVPPSPEPPAAVSRRAALLVEAPEEQSKVKTYLGAVVWKVDNVSNGPGEPLSTAVSAEIDIPEEQLQAVMTFQKNFDSTLPASHTMKLQFTEAPGGPLGNVQQISVPQMRREDSATGDALTGVPVPITDNSFLVGLSRGSSEQGNLDLIKSREWIDVPMLLSNGKIAKLTFEKGPAGQRALDDALASWQTQ